MKKSSHIASANLSDLAYLIYKKVSCKLGHGWFSQFVSEQLVEHYGKQMERKILTQILNEKTKQRNKLETEINNIAKRLGGIK